MLSKQLPKTIASGACQKTGATALRQGGGGGGSTTKLADGQNGDASSGTSTKTSQLQRQVRFYRSDSVLFQKQKKKNPGYAPQPNRGTTGQQQQQKSYSLKDQVCIAQTTTRTDSVPKNILNLRTCNISNTGVGCCQQQPLKN